MMMYGDCKKICKDFALKFGDEGTGCCITTTHHLILLFSAGNLTQNTPTDLIFLFPQLQIELQGRHFGTIQVVEAELQAVLNTLTDKLQDAFKKWQKCWEWCIHAEGNYFDGDGGQANSFYQMAEQVLGYHSTVQ
jgi:hypothetical protein